jgi:SRSO17 transposase
VIDHLGDPDAVLVVDETGDVKKGSSTVGTQRQYTGTAGRIENAQVAVYLAYVGAAGYAMIGRELYLPRCWMTDSQRCTTAGIPADIVFATRPALAATMIDHALDAGVPARWVAADEVYGADPGLRADLEKRQVGYVLAIGCDRRVPTAAGPMRPAALTAGCPRAPGNGSRPVRGQGPALLRLGSDHSDRRIGTPLAAHPPPPPPRRTRLLPLLLTHPGPAC